MGYKTTLLLVLAAFSYANAFMTLIPEGKELIYDYHGLITAGTSIPSLYASSFVLDGKLHMQTDKNSTFMKFSDLKFKLDNGRYDDWHEFEGTEIPLPDDLHDFYKVFQVVYDHEGNAMGLQSESTSDYVINFQKAIGSMMQLDMEKVNLESKKPHAFHDDEMTVHGRSKAYYNVMPLKDSIRVEKMMENRGARMEKFMNSNIQRTQCDRPFDKPVSRDSQKVFNIIKKDSLYILEELESYGGVYFHPYQGQSSALYIYVNQTMEFVSMEPIKTKLHCKTEKFHDNFEYKLSDMSKTTTALPDVTFGRHKWNQDKLLIQIEKMMVDAVHYLQEFHLNTKQPDIKHGQLITRMSRLMMQLETEGFEKLYEAVLKLTTEGDKNKQYMQMYIEMIPLIGTKASMETIVKLIKEKKVKEGQAMKMLQNMGINAKVLTKDVVDEMSVMMHWGEEFSMPIRKTGLYCFATLLMKATIRERMGEHHHHHQHHEDRKHRSDHYESLAEMSEEEKLMFPGTEYYEKYIMEMVKMMKATEDYNMRIAYMHALLNTQFQSVVGHLTPIIKGEMWDDSYLRLTAAMAVHQMISRNEDLVFELYWPMMTDFKLPLSTRIMMYYLIMETKPSLSRLINLFWHLENEKDNAMYQFHYAYLVNKANGVEPCNMDFRLRLKQILRYTRKPHMNGLTTFHRLDYYQTKYGYSQNIDWFFTRSDRTHDTERIFKITFGNEFNGMAYKAYKMFIRVTGVEESIIESMKISVEEAPNHLLKFKTLKKYLKELEENKDFKLNFVILKQHQVIMDMNIDHSNFKDMTKMLGMWVEEQFSSTYKFININYQASTTVFLPTEMGFLAAYQRYIPSVHYFDWDVRKESANNLVTYKIDAEMKIWAHGRLGLSFFNPMADVWQGVNKYHSYDASYPLLMDVTINPQQQSAKISLKRHGKIEEDTFGFKSHVTTLVYVKDDFDKKLLQKCSPKKENFIMVSNGDEYRKEYTLYEKDNSNTGYMKMIKAFDSERFMADHSINYFNDLIGFKTLKESKTIFGDLLLYFFSGSAYAYIQPQPETNGFLCVFVPSKQFPITQNDLTIRFNNEYKQGEWLLMPGAKINMRANYVLKNKEKTVKTWDVNMLLDLNVGHTMKTLKMQIVRMIPGQKDYRICIDAEKKWLDTTVEAKMTWASTHAGEDKCGKDDIFLELEALGEQLEDQKLNKHNYVECMDRLWSDIHEEQTLGCYATQSSIRKYTWNIKTHEVPIEFRNFFNYWLDMFRSYFKKYLHVQDSSIPIEKDHLKVVFEYPMMSETRGHLTMYTPNKEYRMVSMPMNYWLGLNNHRDNLHYNRLFKMMYHMGMLDMCFVSQNSMTSIDGKVVPKKCTSEYSLYIGDSVDNCQDGVYVKKIDGTDKIAVKFVHKNHNLEIIPKTDDHYEILLDGVDTAVCPHTVEWMYFNYNKDTNVVNILMNRMGGHFLFDGHHLHMDLPRLDMEMFGACYKA